MKKLFQLEIILSIFKSYLNENLTQVFSCFFMVFVPSLTFRPLHIFIYFYIYHYKKKESFVMTGTRIRWANAKQKMKVSELRPDLKEVCVFRFRCVKFACIVNWLNDPNPYYHHMSMRYWIGDHFQTFRVWLPCELWWVT